MDDAEAALEAASDADAEDDAEAAVGAAAKENAEAAFDADAFLSDLKEHIAEVDKKRPRHAVSPCVLLHHFFFILCAPQSKGSGDPEGYSRREGDQAAGANLCFASRPAQALQMPTPCHTTPLAGIGGARQAQEGQGAGGGSRHRLLSIVVAR